MRHPTNLIERDMRQLIMRAQRVQKPDLVPSSLSIRKRSYRVQAFWVQFYGAAVAGYCLGNVEKVRILGVPAFR